MTTMLTVTHVLVGVGVDVVVVDDVGGGGGGGVAVGC